MKAQVCLFLPAALLAVGVSLTPCCTPLTPEQLAAREARRAHDQTAYHRMMIVAPSPELREYLASELTALGFDVTRGELASPWGGWAGKANSSSPSTGAVAVVRVTDSRPAWVTHGRYPTYALGDQHGRPAYRASVELVVNDASGKHLKTYYGSSKAEESWNRREAELSALRSALRFFPRNSELDW